MRATHRAAALESPANNPVAGGFVMAENHSLRLTGNGANQSQTNQAMNISFTPMLANMTPTTMIFVFFILLMMFGAKKLPDLAKGLGQAIREFSKAKNDITDEIMREADRPTPTRQIDTPPAAAPVAQAAGTHPTSATQTVSQASTVPHDHV